MIQQRKAIKSYNQMLLAYEDSCMKIKNRYVNQSSQLNQDSVHVLNKLFQSYLLQKRTNFDCCQQTKAYSTQQSSNKKSSICNKVFQEDLFYCPASTKKDKQNRQQKINENCVIAKQIGKLNLGPDFLMIEDEFEEQEDSPTKRISKYDNLKNKNTMDIILQSQKKIEEKKKQQSENQINLLWDDDSQYEITDYSSNQSSNDGSYSPYYVQQIENKPLFGGMFSKTNSMDSINSFNSNSTSNLLNFNFSSKELLKSPKKLSKSKRPRMYVRAKKIPKWAENLEEVEKICEKQDVQATHIFGRCVVEHLDTNIIFNGKCQIFARTSSAKWNSQMFLT